MNLKSLMFVSFIIAVINVSVFSDVNLNALPVFNDETNDTSKAVIYVWNTLGVDIRATIHYGSNLVYHKMIPAGGYDIVVKEYSPSEGRVNSRMGVKYLGQDTYSNRTIQLHNRKHLVLSYVITYNTIDLNVTTVSTLFDTDSILYAFFSILVLEHRRNFSREPQEEELQIYLMLSRELKSMYIQ